MKDIDHRLDLEGTKLLKKLDTTPRPPISILATEPWSTLATKIMVIVIIVYLIILLAWWYCCSKTTKSKATNITIEGTTHPIIREPMISTHEQFNPLIPASSVSFSRRAQSDNLPVEPDEKLM
mgnify:CR=1 FL=1